MIELVHFAYLRIYREMQEECAAKVWLAKVVWQIAVLFIYILIYSVVFIKIFEIQFDVDRSHEHSSAQHKGKDTS